MKLFSDALKITMVAGLALTGAAVQATPSFAAGTASASCAGIATITAIRPAGQVALPQADASGYSPWTTDYFTVNLDSRGRFFVQCFTIEHDGIVPRTQTGNVPVRCADRSNALKARRAPGRIEFQCYARDHRH